MMHREKALLRLLLAIAFVSSAAKQSTGGPEERTAEGDAHYDTCQSHSALGELSDALAERNASLHLLAPFGAEVKGLNLLGRIESGELRYGTGLAAVIERAMAQTGVIIFRGMGTLNGDEQVLISKLFGAGEMDSTHGEHHKAGNEHIFRLSNQDAEGIVGPGGMLYVIA